MTLVIPSTVPTSFNGGDTVEFTQVFGDYPPSDGWTLAVRVLLDTAVDATVTDDGEQTFTVTLAASDTDDIVTETVARIMGTVTGSGAYAGRRYTVIDQYVTVLPNLATATTDDLATHATRTLAIIEAAIEGTLPASMSSYSIGGRSVQKYSPAELMGLKARYQHQVWLEQNPRKANPTMAMAFNASR